MNTGCFKRFILARPTVSRLFAAGLVLALLSAACSVLAQEPAATNPIKTFQITIPDGYTARHTVDAGGRVANPVGSGAMYSTLVNMQSGPRVQAESFDLHRLPTNKHALVDDATAIGSGFGGDPYNFAKLDMNKAKIYEFSGLFRRNRQYFDYDLLGNPNVPAGMTVPIGPSASPTGSLAWPQVQSSPFRFNTVRRMIDTSFTLYPQSVVSYRFAYARNTMEGPTLSPARSAGILKYASLLLEYQRNAGDDFTGAIDWKPNPQTRITYEQQVYRYKADSFFTLNPDGFLVQEADGTPAYLGDYDATSSPYTTAACNTTSMINSTTILYANSNGKPIIDPACAVVLSYIRSQPTRVTMPTEIVRFQSTRLKNIAMNGQASYSWATMNLPSYYEAGWGLNGTVRNAVYRGYAKGRREVVAADFGLTWQATPAFSLSDHASFMSSKQPASSYLPASATLSTPSTAGSATVNYTGTLTSGTGSTIGGTTGAAMYNYYGNEELSNSLTASWIATPKTSFSFTYRWTNRNIGQGVPHEVSIPVTLANPVNGTVAITENAGIFTAAYRPSSVWEVNGSIEGAYNDNAFTTMTPRQLLRYRVHGKLRPRSWATLSLAYNDIERHNNTNNNADYAAANVYDGPLDHRDYTRTASISGVVTRSESYDFNFDYVYTRAYTATNICFASGASTSVAGAATLTAAGAPNLCSSGTTWKARFFQDAPTQFGSAGFNLHPTAKLNYGFGYRISSVAGSQFFPDARNVNGSLVSTYQTPYANVAWTLHPGLIWKAEYNYFGYGEGGVSGAQSCTLAATSTSLTSSSVVPCSSLTVSTGMNSSPAGMTAPRNFHANNVSLGVHYEF